MRDRRLQDSFAPAVGAGSGISRSSTVDRLGPLAGAMDPVARTIEATGDIRQLATWLARRRADGQREGAGATERGAGGARSAALPFAARIQAAFGPHDISGIVVNAGKDHQEVGAALGMRAWAAGEVVSFAGAPDLRMAAHEAAHVVQQRGGMVPLGSFSRAGDAAERHADAVADRVVRGESAVDLLGATGAAPGLSAPTGSLLAWGGSDHYMMGNRAAELALGLLAKHGIPRPEGLRTRQTEVHRGEASGAVCGGAAREGSEITAGKGQTIALHTQARQESSRLDEPSSQVHSEISFGAGSRYAGDYVGSPTELGKQLREHDVPGWDYAVMGVAASSNAEHFYPRNKMVWQHNHEAAVKEARKAAKATNPDTKRLHLEAAMLHESYASHFLQDCFAAGHFAPRMLDAVGAYVTKEQEGRLGLSRTKPWHDFFNMLPDGLPTTHGRFHGDYYMDGNDLEHVAGVTSRSLLEVLSIAAGRGVEQKIAAEIPRPDYAGIMADPVAGPAWKLMTERGDESGRLSGYAGERGGMWEEKTIAQGESEQVERDVFGQGTKRQPVEATVSRARRQVDAIIHYCTAGHDRNVATGLDDDLERPEKKSSPQFGPHALEDDFGLLPALDAELERLAQKFTARDPERAVIEKAAQEVRSLRRWIATLTSLGHHVPADHVLEVMNGVAGQLASVREPPASSDGASETAKTAR